jgi:demethylmenaquinone methyltransferase/2-methoxy-6-polyprenyl-1,4-benzoquinol methylase
MKKEHAVKEVFTELAPRYEEALDDELRSFWGWSYEEYINQLIDRTEIVENQKILDIATGTGKIPRNILQRKIPGIRIIGLDITESMLIHAKEKLPDSIFPNLISLTCADAMALPFPNEAFDVIVTGLATHHLNTHDMLREIKRTLKRDGKLSMIDAGVSQIWHSPIISFFARVIAFIIFLFRENPTRAYAEAMAVSNVYTADEWFEILSDLGFSQITIEEIPMEKKWLPAPLAMRAVQS